ncbi:MAG: ABC transporter permease [Ruthenibacterium sp.]
MKKIRRFFKLLFRSSTGTAGLVIVIAVCLCAAFAAQLAPHDPNAMDLTNMTKPPVWMEGGDWENVRDDNLGRDILSRMLYGAQISLVVGVLATLMSGALGMVLGLVSGYYGGIVDHVIMRIADAFYAIPGILLALVTLMVFNSSGIVTLVLVIAAISWVQYARLIRSEVLRLKKGARARVKTLKRCRFHHFSSYPAERVAPVLVVSTMSVAGSIITEASLSFLGVGIQAPLISWGGMLSDGRVLLATHWWVATFPGIMITVAILGITFLGNWLRDVLDPHNKGL